MKIALPNKGSLADASIQILKEAGYRQRSDARDLVLLDPENSVEFYYLRPRDIALYVGSGELQAGITGRDLLIDSGANTNIIDNSIVEKLLETYSIELKDAPSLTTGSGQIKELKKLLIAFTIPVLPNKFFREESLS